MKNRGEGPASWDERMANQEQPATWTGIAQWYDGLVESGSGPHETALACTLKLVGELGGQDVLDIACGQGLATRGLARKGANRVTGVDSSAAMLELARGHEAMEPLGISYVEDDAQTLGTFADARFSGVNCQLGLMDIPDLPATVAAVHRVLRAGGWFVFVIGHPCFLAPHAVTLRDAAGSPGRLIVNYLNERFWRSDNSSGVRRAGNYHRTLATYINAVLGAGFLLDVVDEPRASPSLAERQPEYASVPIFWATRAHKT